jgi:aspartate/methionine/tyrosine aminotransferase
VPNFFGGTPVSYTLKEERNYQIDPDQIESLITDRTRILVINTPGNPTGAVQTRETLEAVAEIAKKHDLLVISDEIYEKLKSLDAETRRWFITALSRIPETGGSSSADPSGPDPDRRIDQ